MGLEIEIEYDDTTDGVWSPATEAAPPLRGRLNRRRISGLQPGNPLIVQLGIALTAFALGAASVAGFRVGRTDAGNRTVALLHLAPVDSFVVQALPTLPPLDTPSQNAEQLLATPWTNTFDRDVSLSVINDGADPVTVLGAAVSALEFPATELTPASTAPTPPGGVSLLRGRAHFVCGDFPADRTQTVAQLSARSADGAIHREELVVDHFNDVAEQAVCARMPTPQVIRSTTFVPVPAPPPPPGPPGTTNPPVIYTAEITASNRAPFPLRMSLPQAAIQSWTGGGGLLLAATGDTIIPPHGTGTIDISVTVADCPTAQQAAADGFQYDTLDFSDGRDPAGYAPARLINQQVPIADSAAIMNYCLARSSTPGTITITGGAG